MELVGVDADDRAIFLVHFLNLPDVGSILDYIVEELEESADCSCFGT